MVKKIKTRNTQQLALFSTPIVNYFEYFLIIPTNQKTEKVVEFFKKEINKKIPLSKENLFSIAHISLFKFRAKDIIDALIISKVDNAIHTKKRFKIKTNGLHSFDHNNISKSLFLGIENEKPIKEIFNSLITSFGIPTKKTTPHITIARSVSIRDYLRITSILEGYNYSDEFICKKVRILKRIINGKDISKFEVLHDSFLDG